MVKKGNVYCVFFKNCPLLVTEQPDYIYYLYLKALKSCWPLKLDFEMALLYTKLQQSSSLAWWKVGRFCTRINKHPLVNSKLMSIWNPFFVVMGVFFCVGKSIKSTSVMLSDETKQSCTKLKFWEEFSYAFILDFIHIIQSNLLSFEIS